MAAEWLRPAPVSQRAGRLARLAAAVEGKGDGQPGQHARAAAIEPFQSISGQHLHCMVAADCVHRHQRDIDQHGHDRQRKVLGRHVRLEVDELRQEGGEEQQALWIGQGDQSASDGANQDEIGQRSASDAVRRDAPLFNASSIVGPGMMVTADTAIT